MRVVCILEHSAGSEKTGAKHEPDKEGHLDSDTGMFKPWGVKDNCVLTAKTDAQDSGPRGSYTLGELGGHPIAVMVTHSLNSVPMSLRRRRLISVV